MMRMRQNRKVGIAGYFLLPGSLTALGELYSSAMPSPPTPSLQRDHAVSAILDFMPTLFLSISQSKK